MAEITASLVKELREKTGAGMMDCKKALGEVQGDLEKAVDWLRTKVSVPVLTNLPFGHVPTKVLLPVGAKVSLSVEGRDALLYWGHTH